MSSRRVYELLDGVQEGVHAFLETCPDTKPTTVDVRIAITEDEVTVEEIDKAQRTYSIREVQLEAKAEVLALALAEMDEME